MPLFHHTELQKLLNTSLPTVNTLNCRFSLVRGLTGESWRIDIAEGISVLAHQQTAAKKILGISSKRNAKLLHSCGSKLGPKVLAHNNHWIIVEWLPGKNVTSKVFEDLNKSGELAAIIAELHRRPLSGHRLHMQQQFANYWQQLDKRRLTPYWLRYQQHFLKITPPTPLKLSPLHMDIHPGNIIIGDTGLRLIDWEYAADGDIALDIAVLFRSNNWTDNQQKSFLQHYTKYGYPDKVRLCAQIKYWLPWVDYLIFMWLETRWQQSGNDIFLNLGTLLRKHFC
ncbi:thiamine kinase [Serratia symbiotica str. 'Cinara cedri']|nr:thiamine kinase [Serratia symbiotica str. 'Cinara cedri']